MCEICRSHPCDPRCPNSDAETQKFFCSNCDELITEDDEPYIDSSGNEFCSLQCGLEYHGIRKEGII